MAARVTAEAAEEPRERDGLSVLEGLSLVEQPPAEPPASELAPGPFDELDVADVVHFVQDLRGGSGFGQCRPAIIVRIWGLPVRENVVQLAVVNDGTNDDPYNGQVVSWRTSVQYADPKASERPEPATWHSKGECR